MKRIIVPGMAIGALLSKAASAHCPLCTAGAAVAAGGAAWMGVSEVVIGLFIGAFGASMGWWLSGLLKKDYFPFQHWALVIGSFLLTVIPVGALFSGVHPVYVSLGGEYGSVLNRTYLVNLFMLGSVLGAMVLTTAPWLSTRMTRLRKGKKFAFQGITVTFAALAALGIMLQLALG